MDARTNSSARDASAGGATVTAGGHGLGLMTRIMDLDSLGSPARFRVTVTVTSRFKFLAVSRDNHACWGYKDSEAAWIQTEPRAAVPTEAFTVTVTVHAAQPGGGSPCGTSNRASVTRACRASAAQREDLKCELDKWRWPLGGGRLWTRIQVPRPIHSQGPKVTVTARVLGRWRCCTEPLNWPAGGDWQCSKVRRVWIRTESRAPAPTGNSCNHDSWSTIWFEMKLREGFRILQTAQREDPSLWQLSEKTMLVSKIFNLKRNMTTNWLMFQFNEVERTLIRWSIVRGEIVLTIDYIMLVLSDFSPLIISLPSALSEWSGGVQSILSLLKFRWCIVNSCLE